MTCRQSHGQKSKIEYGGLSPFWNCYMRIFQPYSSSSVVNSLCYEDDHVTTKKNQNFINSRKRTDAILKIVFVYISTPCCLFNACVGPNLTSSSSSCSLPARRRPQGLVVIGVCLSVCLSVCAHCFCPQDIWRTGSWITTKFGGWEQGVNL